MNKTEMAVKLHKEKYSCAQAILVAFADEMGISSEAAYKLGDGLGRGFGRLESLCGAVNAMGIVIGSINSGTPEQKGETKEFSMAEVRRCAELFKQQNGSLICHELRSENSEKRSCNDLVRSCAQIIEDDLHKRSRGDIAVMTLQGGKQVKIELNEKAAPLTVANFKNLIDRNFYDGLIFHRVIRGFMIQGGCPNKNGSGGGDTVKGEFASNGWNNPIKHHRGVISMARTSDPNSASSQFFIMHQNASHLDGQYAAFGCVIEGMEVVDEIAAVKTDERDKPLRDVVIEKITLE